MCLTDGFEMPNQNKTYSTPVFTMVLPWRSIRIIIPSRTASAMPFLKLLTHSYRGGMTNSPFLSMKPHLPSIRALAKPSENCPTRLNLSRRMSAQSWAVQTHHPAVPKHCCRLWSRQPAWTGPSLCLPCPRRRGFDRWIAAAAQQKRRQNGQHNYCPDAR